jgi:hypothetical protein
MMKERGWPLMQCGGKKLGIKLSGWPNEDNSKQHDQNDIETSKIDTRVPRRSDGRPVGILFPACHPKIRSFAIFY